MGHEQHAAGNLTQPGPIGGTYVFDAENHLLSAGGMAYLYDGDGKRVGKAPANTPTQPNYLYWYGGGRSPTPSLFLEEYQNKGFKLQGARRISLQTTYRRFASAFGFQLFR